jgi:hypothetical protein
LKIDLGIPSEIQPLNNFAYFEALKREIQLLATQASAQNLRL